MAQNSPRAFLESLRTTHDFAQNNKKRPTKVSL